MDKNKAKQVSTITEQLHDDVTQIYEHTMDEEYVEATKLIDSMVESLKHLKTNLKNYEV